MKRPIELPVQQPLEQTVQAGQLFQSDLATVGIDLKLINDTFANLTSVSGKAETDPRYVDPLGQRLLPRSR